MKFISRFLPFVLLATLISACAGGGGGVTPRTQPASASRGIATGTLVIGLPATKPQARSRAQSRRPDYVSADTTYATLWIDSATSGTRVACTPGASKTCSINWTSTSGSHLFSIAVDDSTSISGGGNVLADGDAQETLTVGSNTLSTISLNGVSAGFTYLSGAVYASGDNNCLISGINCFAGTFEVTDADGQIIDGPGNLDGSPSASPPANGTVFVSEIPSNGQIGFNVACAVITDPTSGTANATSGDLSIALPTANGTSPYVSAAQLSEYSLQYQSKITVTTAFPSFMCTNGTISTAGVANGTVTAN